MRSNLLKKGLIVGIIVLFLAVNIPVTGTINNVNTKLEEQQNIIEKTSITNIISNDIDWWPAKKPNDINSTDSTYSEFNMNIPKVRMPTNSLFLKIFDKLQFFEVIIS